jgi:hypothetical protein
MMTRIKPVFWAATFLIAAALRGFGAAEEVQQAERVEYLRGKVMIDVGGKVAPAERTVLLPNSIKVMTNGTYRVAGGKVRTLKEGEVIDKEGLLLSADGTIMPVIDHITMKNGKLLLVTDGDAQPLAKEFAFPDASKIVPDGTLRTSNGKIRRLLDGDWITLTGKFIASRDSVTLQQGTVVVQKDGGKLKLRPDQTIMMNDGTKAFGNGKVIFRDGSELTLDEGQVVILDGVVPLKK